MWGSFNRKKEYRYVFQCYFNMVGSSKIKGGKEEITSISINSKMLE